MNPAVSTTGRIAGLFALVLGVAVKVQAAVPFPAALDAAAVAEDRLDDVGSRALVIGNGDLNALLYSQGASLRLRISKNDVWDARVDTSEDPPMARFDVSKHTWVGGAANVVSWWNRPYPQPRICANLILGNDAPTAVAPQQMHARLDLSRALAEVSLPDQTKPPIQVRTLAARNVFLIHSDLTAKLAPQPADFLPAAETGTSDGVTWLRQRMPADEDYPGMEIVTALGTRDGVKAVAVVTSWESKDVLSDALKLVRQTLAADTEALVKEHDAVWQQYWSASGVELGDRDFQNWWYRMVYYMRCFSKPGVVPVGLFAGLASDETPWHSSYKINYNIWQTFWAPLAVNHPDLVEPWVRYLKQSLARARWFAKVSYDCEGACYHSDLFPFEPDPARCKAKNNRQCAYVPWGYTLGMSGMAVQNLWLCHLYRPDRKYLEEEIYPVLRDVAIFYASFMEKCQRDADGKVLLGPSFSPEHGNFGTDNNPYDISFIGYTFDAAIQAATTLGCDEGMAVRWRKMRGLLPACPTAPGPGEQPVVVDWQGCKFNEVPEHNITVPVVPVFPGDQVTWFSPLREKDLYRRTIGVTRHNGNNSNVMLNVARARLSMPQAVTETRQWFKGRATPNGMFAWQGHGNYLSESSAVAALVSELLVQSVGNVIRVFPCWPKEIPAGFADLRAQGGFLVSAQQADGKIVTLAMTSTVGGRLRLLAPWPAATVDCDGKAMQVTPGSDGIVELDTKPGERLSFHESHSNPQDTPQTPK